MITAYRIAKRNGKTVIPIDMPIEITMHRLSRVIGIRKILKILIKGSIEGIKEKINIESLFDDPREEEVEKIKKLLRRVDKDLYKVLLTDRNLYMARKINEYKGKKLVIVGAAHARDIFRLVQEKQMDNLGVLDNTH